MYRKIQLIYKLKETRKWVQTASFVRIRGGKCGATRARARARRYSIGGKLI